MWNEFLPFSHSLYYICHRQLTFSLHSLLRVFKLPQSSLWIRLNASGIFCFYKVSFSRFLVNLSDWIVLGVYNPLWITIPSIVYVKFTCKICYASTICFVLYYMSFISDCFSSLSILCNIFLLLLLMPLIFFLSWDMTKCYNSIDHPSFWWHFINRMMALRLCLKYHFSLNCYQWHFGFFFPFFFFCLSFSHI